MSKNRIVCLILMCPNLLNLSQKTEKEDRLDYLINVDILIYTVCLGQ